MLRRSFLGTLVSVPAGGLLLSTAARAQNAPSVTSLAPKLHLLAGVGGNIAILEGEDGLLLIDSGLPDTVEAMIASTGKIGKGQVTRLINTHWHYDHTGGNTRLGKDGAKILAHENVKARLSTKQTIAAFNRTFEPLDPAGQPAETFRDPGAVRHGNETVQYERLPPAHTDGDTVIRFESANVLHGGDLLFNGMYPFIDYSSGGSLAGMASNAVRIQKMVDAKTKIVPGHGPLATKADVKEYGDMLEACHGILAKLIKQGKTLEEVQAAKPFAKYDDKWGKGFMKPEQWVAINYLGMTGPKKDG